MLQLLRTWALLAFVGLPAMLAAHAVKDRPQLLVSVVNNAGVDNSVIVSAEETASRIYQEAGLAIVWKNCRARPSTENENCIPTVDRRHLVLRIEHQPKTLTADVFGVAFLGADGTGVYCDVFYDRIADLHHEGRASIATILGVVAAHELGHLLLGSHSHSTAGIMRPQLQAQEFGVPGVGLTTFSRQQMERMSDRMERN